MEKTLDVVNKILLFDFDGTLVETEILAKKVISQYFEERNFPSELPYADMIVGRTWKAATEDIFQHAQNLGVILDEPSQMAMELKRRYQLEFQKGVQLIPGFKECLPYFKSKAKFLGIVTGSERHEVESILGIQGILGDFDRIWGFGDYEHSKPHPSPYLTALRELQAGPHEVIVFEDSVAGMESAVRAGLNFVQIAHEGHAKVRDERGLLYLPNWEALLK